ncbi:hypothetical protein PIB30_007215 [Stylosanthes scabra]|uniref:Uncharacterized protein n=1 Tax=Stylosanthes scabra TaxID=79078 RepID=A0ABU6V5X2_9FABA|nr:hypothetical protein [Stylosanthes scabra]
MPLSWRRTVADTVKPSSQRRLLTVKTSQPAFPPPPFVCRYPNPSPELCRAPELCKTSNLLPFAGATPLFFESVNQIYKLTKVFSLSGVLISVSSAGLCVSFSYVVQLIVIY